MGYYHYISFILLNPVTQNITITINATEAGDYEFMYENFCDNYPPTEIYVDNTKITNINSCETKLSEGLHKIYLVYNHNSIVNIYCMFCDMDSVISIDLSNFDTSKITDMRRMFCYCSSLKSINLSNFNTSKITDMYEMFYGCSSL